VPAWAEAFLSPIALSCLQRDPQRRPSFTEVILKLSHLTKLPEPALVSANL
jgi:hypothetical protein